MLLKQRFGVRQESEYAGSRGMRTGDHCRSDWSVDYAYAFTSGRRLARVSTRLLPKLRSRSLCPANFLQTPSRTMSLLAVSRRAAWRAAPRSTRSVVVEAAPKDWVAKREAVKHHAIGASVLLYSPMLRTHPISPRHYRPLA